MYVCICEQVNDRQIQKAIDSGLNTLNCLKAKLNVATQCGQCESHVCEMLQKKTATSQREPTFVQLAPLTA